MLGQHRFEQFHLVRKNLAILQNQAFLMAGYIGNVEQFPAKLFKGVSSLAQVAPKAAGAAVEPGIATTSG